VQEEQKEWLRQIPRLFMLSIIYDLAFIDPFTAFRRLNPILGLITILAGGIIYILAFSFNFSMMLKIASVIILVGLFYTIIASYRRRPIYVFNLEESEKIVKEKGLILNDLKDINHARAIIEYSLYLSQKASNPQEMKKYLDIAYDTWFKVIKSQRNNLYLGLFKRKS
jgi:hypothetical protein